MSDKHSVIIENLNKTFYPLTKSVTMGEKFLQIFNPRKRSKVAALSDINIQIEKGEFLGIIGKNGSGKSTLLKIIIGAIKADKGSKVITNGKIVRLALGMGFDKNLSARDNIYVNGAILGLSFRRIGQLFDEIINFAELRDFVDTPIKFYSNGMRSRLAFSIAMNAEADIYLFDEFFGGVGDLSFRKKSDELFKKMIQNNKTIIHVSHNLQDIKKYSSRVIMLHKGKTITQGHPDEVVPIYKTYN